MRLRLGIVLLILSYALGWPAVVAVEGVAVATSSEWLAIYAGPGVYLFSWLLMFVSIAVGGREAVNRVRQWTSRRRPGDSRHNATSAD